MLKFIPKFYYSDRSGIEAKETVGIFSNVDKLSEVLPESEGLIKAQYKYLIERSAESDTRILVNGYNEAFLDVYNDLDSPAELIILVSADKADSKDMGLVDSIKSYFGNKVTVISFLIVDENDNTDYNSRPLGVSKRVYEEAVIQYLSVKLCSSFILMLDCAADSEYGVLTVAAEAFSANKPVVKYSFVDGAVNAEQLHVGSIELSNSIYRDHGISKTSKVAECSINKYCLINLLHGDKLGTYTSFTPYIDTLSEIMFQKRYLRSALTQLSEIKSFA